MSSLLITPIIIPFEDFTPKFSLKVSNFHEFSWDEVDEEEEGDWDEVDDEEEGEGYWEEVKEDEEKEVYEILLGEGHSACVYKDKDVAVKVFKPKYKYAMSYEIENLKMFKGKKGFVQYISHDFRKQKIVMELLGDSLYDMIYFLPKNVDIRELLRQLLESLLDMKKKDMLHLDLKPENIATRGDLYCIIDLGNAEKYRPGKVEKDRIIQTANYRAFGDLLLKNIGFHTDIWSVACIIYEAHFGEYLFSDVSDRYTTAENFSEVCRTLKNENVRRKINSLPFSKIIWGMLATSPYGRITVEKALLFLYLEEEK